MPHRETSKRLKDVTHLFLSGRNQNQDRERAAGESYIYIACIDGLLCRAFIAAGAASALVSEGMNVSLLEAGMSLPNIGYYFGREAPVYLTTALGLDKSVSGGMGDSLQYTFSARVKDIALSPSRFGRAGGAHLVVCAFGQSSLCPDGSIPAELLSLPVQAVLEREGGQLRPGAFLIFGESADAGSMDRMIASFRQAHRGGVVFVQSELAAWGGKNENTAACESFDVPADLREGLARRMPSDHPFFRMLMSRVLRVVSSRRKADKDHAPV